MILFSKVRFVQYALAVCLLAFHHSVRGKEPILKKTFLAMRLGSLSADVDRYIAKGESDAYKGCSEFEVDWATRMDGHSNSAALD